MGKVIPPAQMAEELHNDMRQHLSMYARHIAKECALVAVNRILECVQDEEGYIFNTEYTSKHPKYKSYWIEVKGVLNRL